MAVLEGMPLIALVVAMHRTVCVAHSAVREGKRPRSCATAPVTCGAAIDVPDLLQVAVLVSEHAACMELPGASTSTHGPRLEKPERPSEKVVEPTVNACGAEAGDSAHASDASLPAAATVTTLP